MFLPQRGFAPILGVLGLAVLLVAVGIGVYLSQQQTVTNSQAGGGSIPTSFYLMSPDLSPAAGPQVPENVAFYVDIYARSTDEAVNLVETKLTFPPEILEVEAILDEPEAVNISNWVERSYDNNLGVVRVIGAVPNPGFVSSVGGSDFMSRVKFKVKPGNLGRTGKIEFLEGETKLYRNVGNTVIENVIKEPMNFTIGAAASASPTASPSPEPTPQSPGDALPGGGNRPSADFNRDNKTDLFDLSILLSKYNTNIDTDEDLNNDGIVNAFDFSSMLNILRTLGVIK